nr:unnamed protein product [Digitaria exilis]
MTRRSSRPQHWVERDTPAWLRSAHPPARARGGEFKRRAAVARAQIRRYLSVGGTPRTGAGSAGGGGRSMGAGPRDLGAGGEA